MEREQIIKALECCVVNSNCNGCPFWEGYVTHRNCLQTACKNALALIKELTEVVERSETAQGCKESVNNGFSPSVTELQRENERLQKALTAKGYQKQEDVLQELNDEVVKKYMEERSVFLEERKNVGEGDRAFWYIQGRIDGMEWVADTVRFTKNEMIDQLGKNNDEIARVYPLAIKEAEADTVRKMQERLKERLEKPEFPWDSFTVAEEVIDQIAKEMLEGLE